MRLLFILFIFFSFAFAKAQTYEVGIFAGTSNIIGDVGSTQYIQFKDMAIGGIFKWNRSNRHSFRASVIAANMIGDDNDSDDISRDLRGLKYNYSLIEASIGIEYTFWEWDLYSGRSQFVPYLYTGLTGFSYSSFALNNTNELEEYDNSVDIAIPIVFGIKANITPKLILAAEVGARYTFTDNLDGSNPDGDMDFDSLRFGNINNNDWYMFSGVTLTYTFGRKPCYCNF
ncbi:hypothetical protein A9Q93_06545 [Nonlabens dokdonensis]|uniref:DUF6089 domain-containing protein n=2 Tax=Nonlabens dokdonensis TaxID=328515 RepID=A0A1Z8AZ46_9FLAO|nr:DUF6089 family protein [Nonlabens dokdonensis]OUS15591.1 hypothetical protein A9Q93_06545 [Nonlabens dokdonensis]